ncbi:MAG: hypothetical protein KC619_35900 [Myxococcales bacterium]|nr:hypothetical protein [Myxococcales bacterium]
MSNNPQKITIAERIDCSQYDTAELIVRVVGTVTTSYTGSSIKVVLVSDGFTPDDPSQDFFGDPIATASFSYTSNSPTFAAGTLQVQSATDLGSMLAVQVIGTPVTTAASLNGRLAIDLALKTN